MDKNLIQKFLIQTCWDEQAEIELEDWIDIEQFAELIVLECAEIADRETSHPCDSYGDLIKQHFGIDYQKSVGKRLMDKYSGALAELAKR